MFHSVVLISLSAYLVQSDSDIAAVTNCLAHADLHSTTECFLHMLSVNLLGYLCC